MTERAKRDPDAIRDLLRMKDLVARARGSANDVQDLAFLKRLVASM